MYDRVEWEEKEEEEREEKEEKEEDTEKEAEKEAKKTAGMCLDEIELSVEIGAEGELRLIGSGAKATGKSAIKLKFKRVKEE